MKRMVRKLVVTSLLIGMLAGVVGGTATAEERKEEPTAIEAQEEMLLTEIPDEEVPMAKSPFSKGSTMMWFVVLLLSGTILISVGASGIAQAAIVKLEKDSEK